MMWPNATIMALRGAPRTSAVRARYHWAVAPDLEGDRDTGNRPVGLGRLIAPRLQQEQQRLRIAHELLQRMTLDPRNDTSDKPTRLAHLDHGDHRAIPVESGEQSAQVIRLRHGAPHRFCLQRR